MQQVRRPQDHADDSDVFGWKLIRAWAGFALRAPRRHPRLAAGAFAAVLLAAVVGTKVLPFKYQVYATILAQPNPLMNSLSNPGMSREWDAPTRAARETVLRRDNLVALAEQTHFVDRYLATRAPAVRVRDFVFGLFSSKERDKADLLQGLVDALETKLWVVVNTAGTVTITFEWPNKEIAFDIVQAAVQSFLEEKHASEVKVVGETIAILETHDARVQKEIAETIGQVEQKEKAFRISTGPRRPSGARIAPDEDMARIQTTLAARQRALRDLETFREQRLAEMQAQLLQQQNTYAAQHPAVQSTKQSIEALSQPSPQVATLRAEVEDLRREITKRGGTVEPDLGASLPGDLAAEARLRLESEDPRLEYERRQLQNLLRQHATLLDRIDSAKVEMDTAQAAFKYRYSVINPPQIPKKTVRPFALMLLLGGLVGGAGLAVVVAVAADLWSGRVVERWQVEQGMNLPVLAEIKK